MLNEKMEAVFGPTVGPNGNRGWRFVDSNANHLRNILQLIDELGENNQIEAKKSQWRLGVTGGVKKRTDFVCLCQEGAWQAEVLPAGTASIGYFTCPGTM